MNEVTENNSIEVPFVKSIARLTTNETLPGKSKPERVFSKAMVWYRPTLDCIPGVNLPAPDSWETKIHKDVVNGEEVITEVNNPVYENPIYAWVQGALDSKAVGISRGRDKAVDGIMPEDWDAYLEVSGGSTFMAQRTIWREGYNNFILTQEGWSDTKKGTYLKYTSPEVILALQDNHKRAVIGLMEEYEEGLTEEDKIHVSSVLASFARSFSREAEEEEF